MALSPAATSNDFAKGSGNTYGNALVQPGASLHQGDLIHDLRFSSNLHLHYHVEKAESLQKAVEELQPRAIEPLEHQKTVVQLRVLSNILRHAAQCEAEGRSEDRAQVDNVRSVAAETLAELQGFLSKLETSQTSPTANRTGNNASHASSVSGLAASREKELQELHRYINTQMLSINSSLLLMQRDTAKQVIQKTEKEDSINLMDALGRSFQLPYAFFSDWQTFEGFLRNKFDPSKTPGGEHVKTGSFVITRRDDERRVLNETNWPSSVYPGCEVSMAVVLRALKLSILRCPRPGCGFTPTGSVEDGNSVKCVKCGLTYRFNRDIDLPSVTEEAKRVRQRQLSEDIRRFGQRHAPLDIADVFGEAEDSATWVDFSSFQHENGTGMEPDVALLAAKGQLPDVQVFDTTATALDWNSGASGLEAWLNTSAMPMKEPNTLESESSELEVQQMRKELHDLKSLQRVHFVALVAEAKPLAQSSYQYKDMPLESQIYFRKILDKFPGLSPKLAERFTKSSVARKDRLQGLRTLDNHS